MSLENVQFKLEKSFCHEKIDSENPPKRPKEYIADLLEQQGILVPRRFKNFEQAIIALHDGKEIIIRSEHTDEYAGLSGLLDSYTFDSANIQLLKQSGEISVEELTRKLIELSMEKIIEHCRLLNLNVDDFVSKISYSFWEKVPGYNRYICADSAIAGRYHIFTNGNQNINGIEEPYQNYTMVESGQIIHNDPDKLTAELEASISEVIEFYEKIKKTDCFDANNCPLVEFQTYEEKNYFLQYRLTRPTERCDWTLDRSLEEDEFACEFVRGATTTAEGLVVDVMMYIPESELSGLDSVDASFDYGMGGQGSVSEEIMSHRRKVHFATGFNRQLSRIGIKPKSHLPAVRFLILNCLLLFLIRLFLKALGIDY